MRRVAMYLSDKYAQELAQAAENVKDHQVSLIMKNGANELWRCTKGNSSCYGFDLVISRFGMAAYGDCDSLVFKVGASYGTEFLARKAVDGYYIEKLEPEFREKTALDEGALRALLLSRGVDLFDRFINHDVEIAEPKYFEAVRDGATKPEQLQEFLDWLSALLVGGHPAFDLNASLFEEWETHTNELLNNYIYDGVDRAFTYLNDNDRALNLEQDWYETSIRTYDGRLIQRLEMLRLCAVKIEQFKKDNPPSDGNEGW